MAERTASLQAPLALAGVWLATASFSVLAVPVIIATMGPWHAVARTLQQLSLWQTWISIAACVLLMVISKRKHAEVQEPWAQAAQLFVMGGLLSALVLHYGLLPQWLAHSSAWLKQAQMLLFLLLHWLCALLALRKIWLSRKAG